jgi:TPR repeat protein
MNRKPIMGSSPQRSQYDDQESQKENSVGRKALPSIPLPPSGRMHGAPMSPVRLNVSEGWPHQATSAEVEDQYRPPARFGSDALTSEEYQRSSEASASTAVVQDTPHRQHYTTNPVMPFQEAQVAELSSPNGSLSRALDKIQLHGGYRRAETQSPNSSNAEPPNEPSPVPRLQYHHQSHYSEDSGLRLGHNRQKESGNTNRTYNSGTNSESPTLGPQAGPSINRHLTPTLQNGRRSVPGRPSSVYSAISDFGPRGHSPGGISGSPGWNPRTPSAHSGNHSPDNRPLSYVDLLNVPYAQQNAPAPIPFNNTQLRTAVGTNASLLSTVKTLEMYRANVKKTSDPTIQYAFAIFLIQAAEEFGINEEDGPAPKSSPKTARDLDSPYVETLNAPSSGKDLLREARQILSKLADRSYPFAQYYLADGYASGLFNKGKEDHDRAFPLFVAASKHGHAESGYRAALCYEFGWGARKDPAKAVQFYRQSAAKNHPGAMTRLGRACLSGDLGMNKYREGVKWLKRATDAADPQYNTAPYHLGTMYETGYGDDIFKDETYAAQLFTQAADLGHAEASYRLGDAYEHGKLSCPRDPALSVHFYTGAAQREHPAAMMALCAWYMVGAEPVLEKDETEAYEWARRAAECG